MPPEVPALRPTVKQDDERPFAFHDAAQFHTVGLDRFEVSVRQSHQSPFLVKGKPVTTTLRR